MLYRIKSKLLNRKLENCINNGLYFTMSITGGLGAQILGYGLFKYFKKKNLPVSLDLSYFETKLQRAGQNRSGLSYWSWELDTYGVNYQFLRDKYASNYNGPYLKDGNLKLKYILHAFQNMNLKKYFNLLNNDKLTKKFRQSILQGKPYLCVHARRGDYLNVASHLISESELESIALKFKKIFPQVVIMSDTIVKNSEYKKLREYYGNCFHIIDRDPNPKFSHSIMRNSSMLICSNSQFSLSAGLLSNGIQLVPKKWFGKPHEEMNCTIKSIFDFGVIK